MLSISISRSPLYTLHILLDSQHSDIPDNAGRYSGIHIQRRAQRPEAIFLKDHLTALTHITAVAMTV